MKGLYFYKLVSPYSEDVTKDCKLTVNEIDHNFITLKDVDIKNARFDDNNQTLVIERNDGDTIDVDLSSMVEGITTNLDVDYDRVEGIITITYNGKRAVIDGLITKDNIAKDVMKEVVTNGTLQGKGNAGSPLGLSPVEQTGTYKPAKRLIDLTKGEFMPKPQHLIKGDRYLTFENVSDYGYLYDFRSVKRMNDDLCNGWRIPSKEDWDNMLNAIEPCVENRNHNSIIGNQVLGKIAGKLLKSRDKWDESDPYPSFDAEECGCKNKSCVNENDDALDIDGDDLECGCKPKPICPPKPKRICPNGVDAYGMRILPAGYGDGCQIMDYFGKRGAYWTSTMSHVTDVYIKRFDYNKAGVVQSIESPQALFSLRLVKDFNGSNHQDVEYVNGMNYQTKLMPSLNSEYGYAIWTDSNVAFTNDKYRPIEPNGGMDLTYSKKYYINEWDGFNWIKKEMSEGDSIVLISGIDCDQNIEYRVVKGTLVSVAKIIYNNIMEEINPELERIDGELSDLRDRATVSEDRISDLENVTEKINDKLNEEIHDRIEGDTQLWDGINREISNRENADSQIWDAINNESAVREQTDTQLWDGINAESSVRENVDGQLWGAINTESAVREDVEKQLWTAINNEGGIRENVDNQLWAAINNEGAVREDVDNQIWGAVNAERTAREDADKILDDKIKAESTIREEEDKKLYDKIEEEVISHEEDIEKLKVAIEEEAVMRELMDGVLQNNINNEAAIREENDKVLHKEIVDETAIREDVDAQLWTAINAESAVREDVEKQLWTAINNEGTAREDVDNQLWTAINNESGIRENVDNQLWGAVNTEIARSTEKDLYLEDRVIVSEGSTYDCANGTLTLETKNPENKIKIDLTGNYGTF